MIENSWKDKYPTDIAVKTNPDQYPNVLSALRKSCQRSTTKLVFIDLDKTLTYGELYKLSDDFAACLQQHADLKPDDRIVAQLPNVLQYPVVVFSAMRTGLIVVNTNPLYTARELEHRFDNSSAKAVVCLTDMTHPVEGALPKIGVKQVIATEVGDILPPLKYFIVNFVIKRVKKMVPAYSLPQATKLTDTLAGGAGESSQEAASQTDDVAVLQYTGGTTGVTKGVMLTHRDLVTDVLQCKALMGANLNGSCEILVAPPPLYHVCALAFHCMAIMLTDSHSILVTDPHSLPSMLKSLGQWGFTGLVDLNTLFVALYNNETFRKLDFSALKLILSGGVALQLATAECWKEVTGCTIREGYGMTETAPVVSANPFQDIQVDTISVPVPSILCRMIGDDGREVPLGERGELCVKGLQVMGGYWQYQRTTDGILGADGWLKTGDIAIIQEDGYIRIVGRKENMILVSSFDVYPNELENVLATLPSILQYAAIGIPGEKFGESIKVFVVVEPGMTLTKEQVMQRMHDNLTGYKRPKAMKSHGGLPTINVGKTLCRELRGKELKKAGQK